MVSLPGNAKLSISKKVLAIPIIAACICFPLMQTLVFNAEETKTSHTPLHGPKAGRPAANETFRDVPPQGVPERRPEPIAGKPLVEEVPRNPETNTQMRETTTNGGPAEDPVSIVAAKETPEEPSRNTNTREGPIGKKPQKKQVANSEVETAPVRREPTRRNPIEKSKTGDNSGDGLENLNLTKAIRRQKIFAISTPKTRYACCIPPKNGCTYHIGLLHRILGVKDYERAPVVHDSDKKKDMDLERFSAEEIRDWLQNDDIPRYIVVRNPMVRTLSAYLDKVESQLPPEEQTVEHFENWIMEEFPEGMMTSGERLKTNPHWMPQTEFCGVRSKLHRSFHVFHFEESKEYVDYLYGFVPREFLDDGWRKKDNVSLREFMIGPKKRTGGTSGKFPKYFRSIDIFDHLARVLVGDIETFDYGKEVADLRKLTVSIQNSLGS